MVLLVSVSPLSQDTEVVIKCDPQHYTHGDAERLLDAYVRMLFRTQAGEPVSLSGLVSTST